MSRCLVDVMYGQFNRSHGFWMEFIEKCPDTLWEEKRGGFLVWQHVYHCLFAYAFFVRKDMESSPIGIFDNSDAQDIFLFKKEPQAPSKEALVKYAKQVKELVDKHFNTLTDADLTKKNEIMSTIIGRELTQLDILTMLPGHNMYHFGACDGALRDSGLPGIY